VFGEGGEQGRLEALVEDGEQEPTEVQSQAQPPEQGRVLTVIKSLFLNINFG
jgi:hypothetical protein